MGRGKRTWGAIHNPPRGAYQARYRAPDGTRHTAPTTFPDQDGDADAWLAAQRAKIASGAWQDDRERAVAPTVADYARDWIQSRVKAREAAGRPGLRWHDLRNTGAVMASQAGATMAHLHAWLGHSTAAAAALRYQHTAQGRDALIAQGLSELATGQVD